MRFNAPHPIPYQGSKRRLAPAILSFIPASRFKRMVEPFAGSAAITLAAAQANLCSEFLISDLLAPLAGIWRAILDEPKQLGGAYRHLWHSQLHSDPVQRFNEIRSDFNSDQDPAKLLFLLARCVKNAVRFNPRGRFNQSPDRRRRGTHPDTMEREIMAAHRLLKGRCEVVSADFCQVLKDVKADDVVYLDPPYQGISEGRDRRYISGVPRNAMVELLTRLNERRIEYVLSYDGHCGHKAYGAPLPAELGVFRLLIEVGPSSQATLNGHHVTTIESIYLSPGLLPQGVKRSDPPQVSLQSFAAQGMLFP